MGKGRGKGKEGGREGQGRTRQERKGKNVCHLLSMMLSVLFYFVSLACRICFSLFKYPMLYNSLSEHQLPPSTDTVGI